jgi:gamma-glutamylcysteine synthetase
MMLRQQQAVAGYGNDLQVIRGLAYAFPLSGMLWALLALFVLLFLA